MDELAARCKRQLDTFRIKELKDVLARVGAAKQGKKQVLLEKIMAIVLSFERQDHGPKGLKPEGLSNKHVVSREEVAKVIDDIYRKMHGAGAADLATKGRNVPALSNSLVRSDEQEEVANWGEAKTRCPCGSSMDSGTMIQCDDPNCMVWQHINCVIIPEKEGMQPDIPPQFYCEICRIHHGDPFCVAVSHPLLPTKMTTSIVGAEGSSPLQNVEKSFVLSHGDQELLRKPNHDLQVWCVLLNDKVAFRMHWPAYADLRVNGASVRVINRPGQQLLGINGRDDGPGIANYTREGTNRITLSAYDARPFCLGIRIIRRLTVDQVLSLIPSQSEGEPFETALARVRRCIGGGGGDVGNNDDSDSDLEVVSEWVTVNLRCPNSGSRMKIAGRFRPCIHMGCFDLRTFVELNQRARKWQCPICLKNYSLENLIIDPFFTRITEAMKSYGEDVTEVEMKPDGCWRPKLEGDAKLRESWRSPDGSISLANGENRSMSQQGALKAVKIEEGLSFERMPLKIGIKRTRDGIWQVNGTRGPQGLAVNGMPGRNQMPYNRVISRSSSATASNDEDPSVNQEPSEHLQDSRRDDDDNSTSMGPPAGEWPKSGPAGGDPEHPKTTEVIVLSDTEEENTDDFNIGSAAASGHGGSLAILHSPDLLAEEIQGNHSGLAIGSGSGYGLPNGPERALPFSEVDSLPKNITPPLDFLGTSGGELALAAEENNFWSPQEQNAPFEFFGSGSDASRPAPRHRRPVRPTPVQAVQRSTYGLSPQQHRESGMLETSYLDYSRPLVGSQSFVASEYSGEARESTRGLSSTDPSLRLFLPHQPARAPVQSSVHDPLMASSEGLRDDWFSLSLGGGESIRDPSSPNIVAPSHDIQRPSQERRRLDSLANTASVLLGMSSNGNQAAAGDGLTSVQRRNSNGTAHRTAHRSRHYFRVDSDSD